MFVQSIGTYAEAVYVQEGMCGYVREGMCSKDGEARAEVCAHPGAATGAPHIVRNGSAHAQIVARIQPRPTTRAARSAHVPPGSGTMLHRLVRASDISQRIAPILEYVCG